MAKKLLKVEPDEIYINSDNLKVIRNKEYETHQIEPLNKEFSNISFSIPQPLDYQDETLMPAEVLEPTAEIDSYYYFDITHLITSNQFTDIVIHRIDIQEAENLWVGLQPTDYERLIAENSLNGLRQGYAYIKVPKKRFSTFTNITVTYIGKNLNQNYYHFIILKDQINRSINENVSPSRSLFRDDVENLNKININDITFEIISRSEQYYPNGIVSDLNHTDFMIIEQEDLPYQQNIMKLVEQYSNQIDKIVAIPRSNFPEGTNPFLIVQLNVLIKYTFPEYKELLNSTDTFSFGKNGFTIIESEDGSLTFLKRRVN